MKMIRISPVLWIWWMVVGCNDDPPAIPDVPAGKFENGVFIVNEGPFQVGTGTIDFYDHGAGILTSKVFQEANGRPLGNIVQSLEVHDTLVYIVVNNANKIEVADLDDLRSAGLIEDIPLPRYFLGLNPQKGYVSSWGPDGITGQVMVLDLESLSVIKSIPTGGGPEKMILVGTSLFVCNGGGFGSDNIVSVIDTQTDILEMDIVVGDNPSSIQMDAEGTLWIACAGKQVYLPDFSIDVENSTVGSLVRLDPVTRQVLATVAFPDVFSSPSSLEINSDGNVLYYLGSGAVYAYAINSQDLAVEPLISGYFYSLGYDHGNQMLYVADAGDFASNGQVFRFTPDGLAQDTLTTGIIPTNFYFN